MQSWSSIFLSPLWHFNGEWRQSPLASNMKPESLIPVGQLHLHTVLPSSTWISQTLNLTDCFTWPCSFDAQCFTHLFFSSWSLTTGLFGNFHLLFISKSSSTLYDCQDLSILWSFIFLLIFSQKKTLCALNFDRRVIISKILYMSMFFIHHQTVSAQRHIRMLYLLTILPYQIGKVTE